MPGATGIGESQSICCKVSVLFALLQEEDKLEQQELLQKRREVEVEEKGKVLELKNLVEQRQVEQVKERY